MIPDLLHELLARTTTPLAGAFAPGRVNLIGEHTDYSGLPVLPFALPFGIAITAAPLPGDELVLTSTVPERFPSERLALAALADRPRQGRWTDYVVAGLRLQPPTQGVLLTVAGDLPVAAGLSSSAALVCAAAMLFAPPAVDRVQLAEAAAVAERYVGTESGGMDQAASLLGRPGMVTRLDFRPLRAVWVPFPAAARIVVADSGVRAEKGGSAQRAYNERVHSCRAAAMALGAKPGGLLADVPGDDHARRARSLADPMLAARAGFVFEEADRVAAATAALAAGDLPALGALLDASHHGLTHDYGVGHPAVDRLVEAARSAGAFGARIVGAGFGGSAIALVAADSLERVVAAMRRAGASAVHVVTPGPGAVTWRP